MSETSVRIPAPVEEVFGVLSDGWLYGLWVVGATHIRKVDPVGRRPEPGYITASACGRWPGATSRRFAQ